MKIQRLVSGIAAALGLLLAASAAHAIPRTFVSATGGGAACTRAAPCATFQAAHDATDPNGEINCIDTAEYGPVSITKSITIDCTGTLASITNAVAQQGVLIDAPGAIVRLRGLTFHGPASNVHSFASIIFFRGSALNVENCTITNASGHGIYFSPPDGFSAKLFVSDSTASDNLNGGGITIIPFDSGSAHAVVDKVRAQKNFSGVFASAFGTTGTVIAHVRDSIASENGSVGIEANSVAGQGIASVTVDRTTANLNDVGVASSGPVAFAILGRSTVVSNGMGVGAINTPGGAIVSYQNNHLSGNASDGVPTAVFSVK